MCNAQGAVFNGQGTLFNGQGAVFNGHVTGKCGLSRFTSPRLEGKELRSCYINSPWNELLQRTPIILISLFDGIGALHQLGAPVSHCFRWETDPACNSLPHSTFPTTHMGSVESFDIQGAAGTATVFNGQGIVLNGGHCATFNEQKWRERQQKDQVVLAQRGHRLARGPRLSGANHSKETPFFFKRRVGEGLPASYQASFTISCVRRFSVVLGCAGPLSCATIEVEKKGNASSTTWGFVKCIRGCGPPRRQTNDTNCAGVCEA